MLLQIETTRPPATDLGYLLAKNPDKLQSFDLSFGRAHAFYPVADADKCAFALLLEVDPIALVRGKNKNDSGPLAQYVNDRPYVAGSFASVAIAQVLRSALGGQSKERPELADCALDLVARVDAISCAGDGAFARGLFEPLGYDVELERPALDPKFEWGVAPCAALTLRGTLKLSELLAHLYVLLPVLDDSKHYFIGEAEVEKLLRRGAGWLELHPQREAIVARYLKRQRKLINAATEMLGAFGARNPGRNPRARRRRRAHRKAVVVASNSTGRRVGIAKKFGRQKRFGFGVAARAACCVLC